jgi:hypothetical protein
VLNEVSDRESEAARALRERIRIYALAAEFNAGKDILAYEECERALRSAYGDDAVWADEQSQVMHRLPLSAADGRHTVWVGTASGLVDAREVSDVIAKLTGKAFWRKLFVRRDRADVREARRICTDIIARHRK